MEHFKQNIENINDLQEGILAAAANQSWDEVSELALRRKNTIEQLLQNKCQVQEDILQYHARLLLDFNEKIKKIIKSRQEVVIRKTKLLRKQHHANAAYVDTYNV